MKVKEILALEKGNRNQITLLKEGMFWRAYNLSAYLFSKHIQAFKITKRYFKVVDTELVYLGFPYAILEKKLEKAASNFSIIKEQDKKVVLVLKENIKSNEERYKEWFHTFEISTPKKEANNCKKVFQKIKNFPILNKTPIESQLFLVSLQKEVNGIT